VGLALPNEPIELPPAVARAFVKDMRAFLAEKNAIKHYTGKLRLFDVKEMFLQMRDHLD
jgi:hypothetical protein